MKKITLSLALTLSAGFVFAQSQRLVFVEEFTQASCGPCASQNPSFNSLLAANTSKVISLKYQASFPGTDPMYTQCAPTTDTRQNYYAINSVPYARMDGNVVSGAPNTFNQTNINSAYATPSAFSMQLNHWFNAANDSIFIYCEITCTQNINMSTPKLRIAMMEKTITFSNAPGSNGEKTFYNVMRKMYPGASGTTLAGSWTVGQKKTISFKEKIPSYIYSKPQIAMVAWIQDDATKNVKQAKFSATASPLAIPPVADFMALATTSCDGIIKFKDQSALFPTSWSWNFGDGETSTLKNPIHKYNTNGTYSVQLTASNANGSNPITKTGYITISLAGTAPTGVNDNICSNGVANLSATASGSGLLNWYNNAGAVVNTGAAYSPNVVGTTDFWVAEMTTNAVMSEGPADNTIAAGATYTAAATQGLIFNVLKTGTLISVETYASTAGNRTIQLLDEGGNIINSKVVNIPIGKSTLTLNFPIEVGTGYVLQPQDFACNLYRNTAGGVYPYNVSGVVSIVSNTVASTSPTYYYFFYNWKVQENACSSPGVKVSAMDTCTSTGINDFAVTNSLDVYPNPSNGAFTTSFNTYVADNYIVRITNTLGQEVYEERLENFSGTYSREINISSYGTGVYMLSISNSKNVDVKKVITY